MGRWTSFHRIRLQTWAAAYHVYPAADEWAVQQRRQRKPCCRHADLNNAIVATRYALGISDGLIIVHEADGTISQTIWHRSAKP